MNEKKIIVIDGNSLLFRAFYATSSGDTSNIMRTHDGTPTNAIFAFANMISKILSSFKGGESIFVGFDADSKTFRKEEFASYKANRKPCPPELIPQFPLSREFLSCLGITHFEKSGIEADDICGTVAKKAAKEGYEVLIYTSDKDYLQLIDSHITVNLLKTGLSNTEEMNEVTMKEKWGFGPLSIIDYKGLCGDSSDNLPGIPGVGDKTAKKLINDYGTFDGIVNAAKEGKLTKKLGESIVENESLGRECYKLTTILTDVDLPFSLDDLLYEGYEFEPLSQFAKKLELKSLLSRLPVSLKKGDTASLPEIKIDDDIASFLTEKEIGLALDIDYSSYHDSPLLGLALASKKKIVYLHKESFNEDLKKVLSSNEIKKNVFDSKATYVGLRNVNLDINGIVFDVLLSNYLSGEGTSSSPELCFASIGADIGDSSSLLLDPCQSTKTGKMAFYSLTKKEKALASLKDGGAERLYFDVELPLAKVLSKMEMEGMPLNVVELEEIGKGFNDKLKESEKAIFEMAGHPFNIASPKQVGDVLFNELGLKDLRGGSTSVEALALLIDDHPIVSKILEYRKYAKLLGTYIEGFKPHVKADGKIHTIFNQALTSTGRLSSSNPNMQNITARDEESSSIKKAFHYQDEDTYFLSIDYSQIELRVLASLSGCEKYINVFKEGSDVHAKTARLIFNLKEDEEVPSALRKKAKAVNFAIIYGTTPFGLSEQIGCSPKEASLLIKNFYDAYPEIRDFLNSIAEDAKKNGYTVSMLGRRRYLREINDPNFAKREAAKRAALNAPIQGSAADLMKIAMINIDRFLDENKYQTKMVLQIHDELVFAIPKKELDTLPPLLENIMKNAYKLKVPLEVNSGLGKTWLEAKS